MNAAMVRALGPKETASSWSGGSGADKEGAAAQYEIR